MPAAPQANRAFKVRARHEDAHHGRLLREPTFEAAAIAYVEHLPFAPEALTVGVIVTDVHSGHEHSFVVHVDKGDVDKGDVDKGDVDKGDVGRVR